MGARAVVLLGSTGSIGTQAIEVIAAHPDDYRVVALAAGRDSEALARQAEQLGVPRDRVRTAADGPEALAELAALPEADVVLNGVVGFAGLPATIAALEHGKRLALANKESLIAGGPVVAKARAAGGGEIVPVDSEHSAVYQALRAGRPSEVARIVLTASGGPFRGRSAAELANVTVEEALAHPTWSMGPKITIDSSTLMNKGLEVIEARWLFEVSPARIQVLIHPQSVVHSMVELCDGSVIAQLGVTDMRLPIQYAFSYPERWGTTLPSLDLARYGRLDFAEPDESRFPCLALAYRALEEGGAFPTVLNAANETAVEAFLNGQLPFTAIASVIETVLDSHSETGGNAARDLADVRAVDAWARNRARELVVKVESRSLGV